jgi:hypothetical protein
MQKVMHYPEDEKLVAVMCVRSPPVNPDAFGQFETFSCQSPTLMSKPISFIDLRAEFP